MNGNKKKKQNKNKTKKKMSPRQTFTILFYRRFASARKNSCNFSVVYMDCTLKRSRMFGVWTIVRRPLAYNMHIQVI